MPNFIAGIPAQGSPLNSAEIRANFLALDARTGKITPRADNPASTKIYIDGGVVYFSNNIVLNVQPQAINLGDSSTGVSAFTNNGFFRDVALVIRATLNANNLYEATLAFIEGPEKASSASQPELIPIKATDLPIARFVVRHTGIDNVTKGFIEPITQSQIIDYRSYLNTSGLTYYSTSVGDRETQIDSYGVLVTDAYGTPIIAGSSIGEFTGATPDGYGNMINPIQAAVNALGDSGGTIFIKKGTYLISEPIEVLNDNIQLVGEGKQTVLEMSSSFSGSQSLFEVSGNAVLFRDLYLKGSLPSIAGDALIRFAGSAQCTVQNCYLESSIRGIEFDSASRNICTNNFFSSNDLAVDCSSGQYNLVTNNQFTFNTADIAPGTNNTIVNNILS
jgi:parallel beta-helix repeat protein